MAAASRVVHMYRGWGSLFHGCFNTARTGNSQCHNVVIVETGRCWPVGRLKVDCARSREGEQAEDQNDQPLNMGVEGRRH